MAIFIGFLSCVDGIRSPSNESEYNTNNSVAVLVLLGGVFLTSNLVLSALGFSFVIPWLIVVEGVSAVILLSGL